MTIERPARARALSDPELVALMARIEDRLKIIFMSRRAASSRAR